METYLSCLFSSILVTSKIFQLSNAFILSMRLNGCNFYMMDYGTFCLTAPEARVFRWLHWGGRGVVWCRCRSSRTDSSYIWMGEKVRYEYRLSAMLGHLQRSIRQRNQAQDLVVSLVNLCCLDHPYTTAWFCVTPSYWRVDLDFEHHHRDRVPRGFFVGWQNAELYAIRPLDQPRYSVSTALAPWEGLSTSRLLLVLALPISSYYSNLA